MAPWVSALLMKQFIGSMGARFLPGLGFEPLQPTRILPVYFPAWVIDGELQASISYGESQRNSQIQCINTYFPGNDFGVLPHISFWYQQLQNYRLVPFTSELENQFDTQVQCLPYTISPFSTLDIAKSWPHGDVEVDMAGFQFTPTSIKPNLVFRFLALVWFNANARPQISAYPILIPLYLAQYEAVIPRFEMEVNLTVFMEGFSKKGRIFVEKTGDQFADRVQELIPNAPPILGRVFRLLDDMVVRGGVFHFVRVAKMAFPQAPLAHLFLRKWLDDKLSSPDLAPLLADLSRGSSTLRGEDERVRDFLDVADRSNVHMWLSLGSKLTAAEMVIETMKSATNVHIVSRPKGASTEEVMGGTFKALEDTVNDLKKQRQDTLPAWWREWEKRESGQEPLASNEKQTQNTTRTEENTQAPDGSR
ncbi:hypothetical protein M378DRAFT_9342 [Amanita muscaria Koide BX008]|uniref:Uncharacterized protein n=1 Tax=Amanita muscaria (strain Koide BX008) TaxID=946122 RepID=A0A0C2XDN9_AMAMK|nr:hypothetical protein M378DRAFT_9342 [Amanita muscaria Koide BX008]